MALVRRILGDAQAKLRKMVDEQVSVSTRNDVSEEPEPADPLITPAVAPRAPPFIDTDRKAALALDRKINFAQQLSNPSALDPLPNNSIYDSANRNSPYETPCRNAPNDSPFDAINPYESVSKDTLNTSLFDPFDALPRSTPFDSSSANGSYDTTSNGTPTPESKNNYDRDYGALSSSTNSRVSRLSLRKEGNGKSYVPDKKNGKLICDDLFGGDPFNIQTNGKIESPVNNSGHNENRDSTYAEINMTISKYGRDRNILDVNSSDDDCLGIENVSGIASTHSPDLTSSAGGQSPRTSSNPAADCEPPSPRSGDSRQEDFTAPTASPGHPGIYTAGQAQVSRRLRADNDRLQADLTRLRRLLVAAAEKGEAGSALLAEKLKNDDRLNIGEEKKQEESPEKEVGAEVLKASDNVRVRQLENELVLAREAIDALKSDKKRLKAEKFDLLNQMKQLYATLEDKEKELRDFIRNYQEMVARGGGAASLERAEHERERTALMRHARDEAERSVQLAAALSARDSQLRHAREQLIEARRQLQLSGCLSEGESVASLATGPSVPPALALPDRGSCSLDSGVRVTGGSDRESGGATSTGGNLSDSTAEAGGVGGGGGVGEGDDTTSLALQHHMHAQHAHYYQLGTPRDYSPTLSPHNSGGMFGRSMDSGALSRSVEHLSSPGEEPCTGTSGRRGKSSRGRGTAWGSISRVFARSRNRHHKPAAVATSGHESEPVYAGGRSWSPLWEGGGGAGGGGGSAALREAATLPVSRWRAPAVLAWLELALGLPSHYAAALADNIKSGKMAPLTGQVLLELTDADLEAALGISAPMHRKKLRLAIEERRRPELVRYPAASQLSHAWVAAEWLPDIGLTQFAEIFMANMVDARMLDNLSKKELEKYLGVTRRFHQASIVHGIHLMRMMKYERQALAMRRHQCEAVDADPLVWTNQRFIRWAHNIDLREFAENLKESGVHGGLAVLEPSFTGETMATALGIPPSKTIIRRHLVAEFDALIMPARTFFCQQTRVLGRPLSRSLATGLPGMGIDINENRRNSIRGSISRALGLKAKHDKTSPSSSSESSSVMSLTGRHQYQACYSPPHMPTPYRTQSQLSMTYMPPPTLQEYEPIYTPLSLCSNSSLSTNRDIYQRLSDLKGDYIPVRYGIQKPDIKHRVSSPLPVKTVKEVGLQRKHRRVKSIGDINAISKAAV